MVFGIVPVFFLPTAAGKYLGHSDEWLKAKAREHDLYKPTIRGKGKGSPNYYHRDHLDIIAEHMMDEENFSREAAWSVWLRIRRNRIQQYFDMAKTSKKKQ